MLAWLLYYINRFGCIILFKSHSRNMEQVPFHKRTFFSAAFVAAGSLGMATGPALAGALENIHFDLGKRRMYVSIYSWQYMYITFVLLNKYENVTRYRSVWNC